MIKIYDYNTGETPEITEAQYDFLQIVIKHCGRMDTVLKEYPVPQEDLDKWHTEPFWAILEGYLRVLIKAKGLSVDYVKEFLLDTIAGRKQPSKQQLAAVNASLKALGCGVSIRPGFNGKATLTPDSVQFEFTETPIDDKPESNQSI